MSSADLQREKYQNSCTQQTALTNAASSQEQKVQFLQKLRNSSPIRIRQSHELARALTKCLRVGSLHLDFF